MFVLSSWDCCRVVGCGGRAEEKRRQQRQLRFLKSAVAKADIGQQLARLFIPGVVLQYHDAVFGSPPRYLSLSPTRAMRLTVPQPLSLSSDPRSWHRFSWQNNFNSWRAGELGQDSTLWCGEQRRPSRGRAAFLRARAADADSGGRNGLQVRRAKHQEVSVVSAHI